MALAPMPDWLLGLARGESTGRGHAVAHWRELVVQGVAQGERNSTIASLTGHLLSRRIDRKVARELLLT